MSLFDSIKTSLGGSMGEAAAPALPGVIEAVLPGGMQGLLDRLERSGCTAQVHSWLAGGRNQPITAADLGRVLGDEPIRQIADRLGIPADQVLATLAKVLPQAVDRKSPDGNLQTEPVDEGH